MHESLSVTVSTLMEVSGKKQGMDQYEGGVIFPAGDFRRISSTAFPTPPLRGYRVLILLLFTLSSVVVLYYFITACWYITNCV